MVLESNGYGVVLHHHLVCDRRGLVIVMLVENKAYGVGE
jgi:hypothetical protein